MSKQQTKVNLDGHGFTKANIKTGNDDEELDELKVSTEGIKILALKDIVTSVHGRIPEGHEGFVSAGLALQLQELGYCDIV